MTTDAERRVATRVKVTLSVSFTIDGGPAKTGTVENISRSGILLTSAETLAPGVKLRVTMVDPKSSQQHEIVGEVVRSAPAGKFGVSFVHVDDAALAFVKTLIGA